MGKKVLIYDASYRDLRPWEIDALFEEFGDAISWYASKPKSHGAYRLIYNDVKPDVVYLPSGRTVEVGRGYFRRMIAETPHCFLSESADTPPVLKEIVEVTLGGIVYSKPYRT